MRTLWSLTLCSGMIALALSAVIAQDANRNREEKPLGQKDPAGKAEKAEAVQRSHSEWFEDGEDDAQSLEEAAKNFIAKQDKNKDGKVSKDELPQHLQDGFVRIDRNKDGFLAREELEGHARRAMAVPQPVQVTEVWILDTHRGHLDLKDLQEAYALLTQIDADKDGKIAKQEVETFETKVAGRMCDRCFTQLDTDKNGQISREEAQDSMFEEDFTRIDADKNNQLTRQEVEKAVENNLTTAQKTNSADPTKAAARPDDEKKE